MLQLEAPSQKLLDDYYAKVKAKILPMIPRAAGVIPLGARRYLTEKKMQEIITGTPDRLIVYSEEVMRRVFVDYDRADFTTYVKNKSKRNKTADLLALDAKYHDRATALHQIFNYDSLISGSKTTSYWLAGKLSRNTCTYCNRLYTNTVSVRDKKTGRFNDPGRITRPEFDHWFAKSLYPVLGLSFYNLIPSCGVCNSSVKSGLDFSLAEYYHPYLATAAETYSFGFSFKSVNQLEVTVDSPDDKMNRTLAIMKLHEVYDAHAELELRDLYDLRHKYPENYLDTILNSTFKTLHLGRRECYRLIFGAEADEADFHKRSFSKFKKDILEALGVKLIAPDLW